MKIDQLVRQMSPPRYTVTQAAREIGKSPDTIRRWRKEGRCEPSDGTYFGETWVPLYTPEDLSGLRKIAKTIKPGRKKKDPPMALVMSF